MKSTWNNILEKYIHNLVSPDGRNTFESTPELVKVILQKAKITSRGADPGIKSSKRNYNVQVVELSYPVQIKGALIEWMAGGQRA